VEKGDRERLADLEIRRWKAFLRLNGETLAESDEDILNEFKGFVHTLKRVGIDYSIIVNVEGHGAGTLTRRARQGASMVQSLSSNKRMKRVGGLD
jgi:hypothetical protein